MGLLRKFAEGLAFGAGFGISFAAVWYVVAYVISPMFITAQSERESSSHYYERRPQRPSAVEGGAGIESGKQFHELGLDEQIKKASVIAVARYERSPDGQMKAIIKEFLKKDPKVELYYKVGDEYAPSSYYPSDKTDYGDGVVIFFTGSPATMRLSMTYSGDRIHGLGDIPIELFREKCKKPDA